MNAFFKPNKTFLHPKNLLRFFLVSLALLGVFLFVGCKKQNIRYDQYVSELRSNIFLAETETLSVRIYSVTKETPYVADGVPQESSPRTEVYLVAPEGDEVCALTFTVGGKEYGGEMSFDNVRAEYYFYCTLDTSALREIVCKINYGGTECELTATSVRTESTLSPSAILNGLLVAEQPLFAGLTDKYGFSGEIYVRLIFEEKPYYYVGVIDRNGNITAFLINGETGKILAKRTS